MKNFSIKCFRHLPFVLFESRNKRMLHVNFKKLLVALVMVFACSSILFAGNSYAEGQLFGDLAQHGGKLFMGMREIIYAVSGFGIIAIVIGSIFGSINWKWLTAIIIGLFVIAGTAAIVNYMVDEDVIDSGMIQDSLKYGE